MSIIDSYPFRIQQGGVKYEFLWDDSQVRSQREGACWRPIPPDGYANVGDTFVGDSRQEPDNNTQVLFVLDQPGISAMPVDFTSLWSNYGEASQDATASLWRPVPPDGYVAIGDVSGQGGEMPDVKCVRCVKIDYIKVYQNPSTKIWTSDQAIAEIKLSIFTNNEFHTFSLVSGGVALKICLANTKYTIKRGIPEPPKPVPVIIPEPPPPDTRWSLDFLLMLLIALFIILLVLVILV